MDFIDFLESGFPSQQKYAEAAGLDGPLDNIDPEYRYARTVEYLSHMIEEVVEARMECVRRPWKKDEQGFLDSDEKRIAFIAEMFDVLLFFRATLAYAGILPTEFLEVANEKLNYNSTRSDHKHAN